MNFPLLKIKSKKKIEIGKKEMKKLSVYLTTPTRFCAFYAIFRHPSNTNDVEWSILRTTTAATMLAIATADEYKSEILNFIFKLFF